MSPGEGAVVVVKIIVAVLAIWLALSVIGFVLKAVTTLLIVAGVATLGVVAYGAIKGSRRRQIGR